MRCIDQLSMMYWMLMYKSCIQCWVDCNIVGLYCICVCMFVFIKIGSHTIKIQIAFTIVTHLARACMAGDSLSRVAVFFLIFLLSKWLHCLSWSPPFNFFMPLQSLLAWMPTDRLSKTAQVDLKTREKCCISHTCDWQARWTPRTNQGRDALNANKLHLNNSSWILIWSPAPQVKQRSPAPLPSKTALLHYREE